MKIVFAGTPEFAETILEALLRSQHQVVAVLTQPDRPAGRGLKLTPSLVKQCAMQNKIPVWQPRSLKLDGVFAQEAQLAKEQLAAMSFDVLVVAAYGLILPQWLLSYVQTKHPLACINVHASLLPRWRGAAPIHRAIWAGDDITGTCIMKMAAGLDTGPIIARETMPIQSLDTTATLHDRLAAQGARILVEVLDKIAQHQTLEITEQETLGVMYAEKIRKNEASIQWWQSAQHIDRQIRALNPFPGANTILEQETVKVWLSENISHQYPQDLSGVPGEIIGIDALGISVLCQTGVVRLLELQKPGAKKITAFQYAQNRQLHTGQLFH